MSDKFISQTKKNKLKILLKFLIPVIIGFFFLLLWTWLGISNFRLNADLSRDLSEISNLWIRKIVWLGPHLRVGFPASPIYFYLLYPGLILSSGSAYSLVVTQALLATTSFIFLVLFSKNKHQIGTYLSFFFIGLSSWWITSTINPWNGNMYVLWVMLALISLWYKKKLWLSMLLLGIAIAIHPAALLIMPIFLYETWTYKSLSKIKKTVYFFGGIIVPWTPILAFEIITKGYLVRQWLMKQDTGMSFSLGMSNLNALISITGISKLLLFTILFYSFIKSNKRAKKWYLSLLPALVFLTLISTLHQYYLLGVVSLLFFIITRVSSHNKIGKLLLFIAIIFFTKNIANKYSFDLSQPISNRLENIKSVINVLENKQKITKKSTYALISVIDDQNSTPQADDYRFILRTKDYKATNITEYPSSDYLVIFFENNQSEPQNWNDWHSDYFGNKVLTSSQTIENTTILIYKRE